MINVCFHGIGRPLRHIDDDEAQYWVSHPQFLELLDEVAGWPDCAISFDDGNASDAELALPALAERGLHATFFVLAGRIDVPGSLSSEQVLELLHAGMALGSHGMDHVSWRGMDSATQARELVEARTQIAALAGKVTEAALPRGQYDRRTLGALRRLGYTRVYTSDRRRARPGAWLQPRFSVTRDSTSETFRKAALEPPPLARRAYLELKGVVKRLR